MASAVISWDWRRRHGLRRPHLALDDPVQVRAWGGGCKIRLVGQAGKGGAEGIVTTCPNQTKLSSSSGAQGGREERTMSLSLGTNDRACVIACCYASSLYQHPVCAPTPSPTSRTPRLSGQLAQYGCVHRAPQHHLLGGWVGGWLGGWMGGL